MRAVPLSYVLRNVAKRRLTTALTAGGMALVVFVFATVLMLVEGLRQTLVATGSADNVVLIRRGSQSEVQSGVDRGQAAVIESLPYVATGADGRALLSKETVVLIGLGKRGSDRPGNVVIRGLGRQGPALRPQARIVQGRMFRPGTTEIVAGRSVAKGFTGAGVGETLRFGQREWTVVGVFDAGGTAFDSEIWGDADPLMQSFRRPVFSSILFRLADPASFEAARREIEADPRLTLEAKREVRFYADQSEALARFIGILGTALSAIFSIGATIGASITMYAAVASRTAEIGTLRALGFPRVSVLGAFLAESLVLGAIGGAAGLAAASLMQTFTLSTMNWQTFSELAFGFALTPTIALQAMAFALAMGFVGGFLPAARAARLKIVDALRAA